MTKETTTEENIHETCDQEIEVLEEEIENLREEMDSLYEIIAEIKSLVK